MRRTQLIARDAAPLFAALGDEVRLSLLSRLKDGEPRSVVQLTEGTGMTRQGISKHLNVMEKVGLVKCERVGRESRFTYHPAGIEQARQYLDQASAQWDDAVERLKSLLEKQ